MIKWTVGEVERLRLLRASGLSNAACGRELGRSVGSVSGQVQRLVVVKRKRPVTYRARGELMREVERLRKRVGVSEMCDILGVRRSTIYRTFKRLDQSSKGI